MMAQSNRKQVEALSEISNIIVKLSDEDLERMESLAEQITPYDPELGDRILDAYALLTQLNDDVELALERLEPDTEDMEEEDIEAVKAEANETDAKVGEDSGEEQEKGRLKRQKQAWIIISNGIARQFNPRVSSILRLMAESAQQPIGALSWSEDVTSTHWRHEFFTYARSVSGMNGPGLDVRQAGRERTRVRGTEDGAHRPLCRRPLEGPLMTPPWYLPASRADGMARLGTLTAEEVQVSMQARTEITDEPGTRQAERQVCVAEMTEGMDNPDSTAPATHIYRLGCPAEAELDALVLPRWRHLFYPHGDESARRSAPRLTDVGSGLEAYAVRPTH